MTILENKLQNIRDKLVALISQLKKISVNNIGNIPIKISAIVVGQNKLPMYLGDSIEYEINENDLAGTTSIDDNTFSYCYRLTSVTIPNSVTNIGSNAFKECANLTDVTIGDGVTTIGNYAFSNCSSLTNITVDADNTAYSSDSRGTLFDKNKTILIQYPIGNVETAYIIPDSVTTIWDYAF